MATHSKTLAWQDLLGRVARRGVGFRQVRDHHLFPDATQCSAHTIRVGHTRSVLDIHDWCWLNTHDSCWDTRDECPAHFIRVPDATQRSNLTENVDDVIWQQSIPAQIRQLIHYCYQYKE